MFEKILVPLGGSEHSMHALKNAVQIAKKFDGKITLIHVYSVAYPVSVSITTLDTETSALELSSKLAEAARKVGASILSDGEKRVKAEAVPVETLLKEGHSVEVILKTAKEGEFDLIVMHACGLHYFTTRTGQRECVITP